MQKRSETRFYVNNHYNDVTSLTIVYSAVYSDADQKNIKAPRHWPLCGEFTGDRWIPHTNVQYRGKCFHLMTSSWIEYWNEIFGISQRIRKQCTFVSDHKKWDSL